MLVLSTIPHFIKQYEINLTLCVIKFSYQTSYSTLRKTIKKSTSCFSHNKSGKKKLSSINKNAQNLQACEVHKLSKASGNV